MHSLRGRQAWHLYEEMPSSNGYGLDMDSVLDGHYQAGHSDSPINLVLDHLEEHGLPKHPDLAEDIVIEHYERSMSDAARSGEFDAIFRAARRGPKTENDDDAFEVAEAAHEGTVEPDIAVEMLFDVDNLKDVSRQKLDKIALDYGPHITAQEWSLIRQFCVGSPDRRWFCEVMDAYYRRRLQRRRAATR